MPRQELAYKAEIDVREHTSAACQPATEVLDGLDILLDRVAAIAAALEVVDVGADNRRHGAALQSSLNMRPFEELLDHRRLPSARDARKEPRGLCSARQLDRVNASAARRGRTRPPRDDTPNNRGLGIIALMQISP
jgi:hypothetical protein